jgi:hypothetical protein
MIFGVLGGAAGIEDGVEVVERRDRLLDADDERFLHGAIRNGGTGF